MNFAHSTETETVSTGAAAEVKAIKTELAQFLEEKGVPPKLYMLISTEPLEGSIEGNPTISQNTGQILYNWGEKVDVGGKVRGGTIRANYFMPKNPYTVSPEDLEAYQDAKRRADAEFKARSKR